VNAKELWKYKHTSAINGVLTDDVDGNGVPEIIAYSSNGEVLILSMDGDLLLSEKVSDKQIWAATVYDNNTNAPSKFLVIGGMDGLLRSFHLTKNFDMDQRWTHKFGSSISGFLLEDLLNNGTEQLISYSLDKTLRVLNKEDGSLIWGQTFEKGIGQVIVVPVLNNQVKKEVVACGNDGTVRVFNAEEGVLKWFKRFSENMRCIATLNPQERDSLLLCGGDDKTLHVIDRKKKGELKSKTLTYSDYVWTLHSYFQNSLRKLLVSTYSFEFLKTEKDVKKLKFTSGLYKYDSNLKMEWKVEGENLESFEVIKDQWKNGIIFFGTTKGDLKALNESNGSILFDLEYPSCVNGLTFLKSYNALVSCHDDGSIVFNRVMD
jgi:outer membrane protein assembly factor BamB